MMTPALIGAAVQSRRPSGSLLSIRRQPAWRPTWYRGCQLYLYPQDL